MKKTLLVLSLIGTGATLMAQQSTTTGIDDGRMAAQDMLNMQPAKAAPIRQTYVPDEVMDRVMGTYGDRLYAVKQVKSGSGDHVYQVTLVDDDQTSVAWVGEAGSEVAYVYRTDNAQTMAANSSSSSSADASISSDAATDVAPSVDDNYNTDNNALDNSVNTLNEPMNDSSMETLAPEENSSNQEAPLSSEMPNSEGALPPSNNLNTNTHTARPDGEQ